MIAWFTEWLSKPRHWVLWLIVANFTVWIVLGIGAIGLWAVFK